MFNFLKKNKIPRDCTRLRNELENISNVYSQTRFPILHEDLDNLTKLITKHYTKNNRYYHNLEHIYYCLDKHDEYYTYTQYPKHLDWCLERLSIIFHDVADTHDSLHPELSSEILAKEALASLIDTRCFSTTIAEIVRTKDLKDLGNLILSTNHFGSTTYKTTGVVADCDLAVLGERWDRFLEYDNKIIKEYKEIPKKRFLVGRNNVLNFFLNKEHIYYMPYFKHAYELRAKENIKRIIAERYSIEEK
jgi:predicted metal-dependent HD superfamily phosphohydrolase